MNITLKQGDCLDLMRGIPDGSVDMVCADPPYFKVKKEQWDRQWDNPKIYLQWLDNVTKEWYRILKFNGSLYCFASPRMAARVECLIAERFNVLNQIVWDKEQTNTGGFHRCAKKVALRHYNSATERIIFAEHYGADSMAKGEAGDQTKCDELRGFVFEPLRAYLKTERDKSKWTNADAKIAVDHSPESGCHWFDKSQWTFPTEKIYQCWQIKTGFFLRPYEELRREYEELRRPFNVSAAVPYTDVWTFEPVTFYKGKHPCEKPQELLKHIIQSSTRENAVILDCFMGTGSLGISCRNLKRNFIGYELDKEYFEIAQKRIYDASSEHCELSKALINKNNDGQLRLI